MKHLFTMKIWALSLTALLLWGITPTLAQEIKVDAQLRSRGEYRNGVKSLKKEDQDGLFGLTQRTRINLHYKSDKLIIGLTVQDVRTWGDTKQAVANDGAKTSIAQAWAQVLFNENISLKLGRQPLSYDDQRILGGLDWANQGRFHDVGVFKYNRNGLLFDAGLAFNQPGNFSDIYISNETGPIGNYKNLQFAWFHKSYETFKMSFLLMNAGYQSIDITPANERTYNMQTYGTHLVKTFGDLKLTGSAYIQKGDDAAGNDVNAQLFALKADYKTTDALSLSAGYDYVSGTDSKEAAKGENNSFNNSLATNHKFYGFMDYFFVGNHAGNVGLSDLNLAAAYIFTPTFSGKAIYHYFTSAADILSAQQDGSIKNEDKGLGSEIDLVLIYNYTKDIQFILGYSEMFASDSMEILKGGNKGKSNNWAWFQINIKPTLFTWKK
ncbi:MAG: alginate export family protein [Cytophagales bacterium]|nr:alginate export family protein [Cytophagales bacterium]